MEIGVLARGGDRGPLHLPARLTDALAGVHAPDCLECLTGFPDVEGIETSGFNLAPGGVSLTGFPDVEGIETSRRTRRRWRAASDRLP